MELSMLAVGLGFFLDLLIGDPHWLYHPIIYPLSHPYLCPILFIYALPT